MTLDEARDHIGHGVVYAPLFGKREYGVITSVSRRLIFARFEDALHAKGCDPETLTLLAGAGQ